MTENGSRQPSAVSRQPSAKSTEKRTQNGEGRQPSAVSEEHRSQTLNLKARRPPSDLLSAKLLRHNRFCVWLLDDEGYDELVTAGPDTQRVVGGHVGERAEFGP